MIKKNILGWIIHLISWILLIYFGLNDIHFINYNFFLILIIITALLITISFWFLYESPYKNLNEKKVKNISFKKQ